MTYKEKLIKLYDKVGGIDATWIETFKSLTTPYTVAERENIIENLDNMANWKYNINDVRKIVKLEETICEKFEKKFEEIEELIDDSKSANKIIKLKEECDILCEAIEYCYITLSSNYLSYSNRLDELTRGY